MGRFTHLIILLLLIQCAPAVQAQSRYHFSTLTMDQGLSSDYVWSMCQDKYGFMWIGTVNGVNRYDGHGIRKYFHDPKDSFSLPGNAVFWIHRDETGDLWFACGIYGVVKYNYAKDRFEKFEGYEKMKKQTGLPAPVWRINEDQRKRILFACGGACFRYDRATGQMENLTPYFKGKIDAYGVAMFIPQGKDSSWVLTDNGLFLHTLLDDKMEHIPFDVQKMGYGAPAFADGAFANREDLVISTPRTGFVIFNTRTRQFRPAPAPLNPEKGGIYSTCGGVMSDSRGRVWVANSVFGLMEYTSSGELVSVKAEPSYPYPHREQEGQGMNVYEDRDGNIWYGTSQRGAVWFQPKLDFIKIYKRDYAKESSLADDRVCDFFPAAGGDMFIANGKGLSLLHTARDSFTNFPGSINEEGNYPARVARHLIAIGDSLVIATDLGLSFYDQRKNIFHRVAAKDESQPYALFSNRVAIVEQVDKDVLLLISGFGYPARFDMRTGKCYSAAYPDVYDTLYHLTGINMAVRDRRRNTLWLEAGNGSLYEYDIATRKTINHHFSNDSSIVVINAIESDAAGNLWLGTNNGLIQYDPVTKRSKTWSLPTATQNIINVSSIVQDKIWISTTNEVVYLDVATGRSLPFNLNVLMTNVHLYVRSLYIDPSNTIWIGSNKGFCRIDSKNFLPQPAMSLPRLVSFRVFDQPKVFDRPYNELSEVELNYNENFFSFDFSSLDFSQTAGVRYRYRLDPFDPDWKMSDKNSASYTNVTPGTYTLLLRTEYGLGKYKDATPITVHIRFPWWRQTWFTLLIVLAAGGIGWLLYRLWQRRKAQQRIDETIDYFANSLYGENSVNEICWDIARNCIAQMKLEDCVVYLVDEKRNVLVQKAAFGPKNPREHEIINPIEIPWGKGIVGATAEAGKYILVKDTSKDERYIVDHGQRFSELAVPIVHEGKVIGVIDSEHSRRNFFTDVHVKLLSTIAAISANKIAEARADAAAQESKLQLLEIKKLLAESQLMALRAQMNPHFVFNCLNSIQECIVMQKYGEASLYLNKFAKLFRSVLNNSGKGMVTVAEEVEVLELYLALEHMRFEKSFSYTITIDEDLETDEMVMPSMLLQPYVENALWHGLMHKQDERKLCIAFQRKTNHVFSCVIEDNGIGRKKALELKEQQNKSKRHVSRGMAISKDRIDLLQKQGQHAYLEIIDKYNDAGEATGTKVVIELSSFLL
jgi:LytS/YehU family sensor histidine kinase/ligand-binding sensor domain-containing protein